MRRHSWPIVNQFRTLWSHRRSRASHVGDPDAECRSHILAVTFHADSHPKPSAIFEVPHPYLRRHISFSPYLSCSPLHFSSQVRCSSARHGIWSCATSNPCRIQRVLKCAGNAKTSVLKDVCQSCTKWHEEGDCRFHDCTPFGPCFSQGRGSVWTTSASSLDYMYSPRVA